MRLPSCRPALSTLRPPSLPKGGTARHHRRTLLTLAIETSCDDTAVAILHRHDRDNTLRLLFNERIASDNRQFRGIEPTTAAKGHSREIASLVEKALGHLPDASEGDAENGQSHGSRRTCLSPGGITKRIPDFVTVTRGPGIRGSLEVGINVAKGLAVAWGVPVLGAHHMQAHALTPRLAQALGLEMGGGAGEETDLQFPFLSLLVSGGHTQLVHSRSLTDHSTLINAPDSAIGNVLDQVARSILPADVLSSAEDVSYGRLLERFAFPPERTPKENYAFYKAPKTRQAEMDGFASAEHGWSIRSALRNTRRLEYSFTGLHAKTGEILGSDPSSVSVRERRALARYVLASAFTQLVGRLCIALEDVPGLASGCKTLVLSGGVASNKFLMHVVREMLKVRGYGKVRVLAPPLELCTDNAAMIAWTGMEMWDAGWESDLQFGPIPKWPMDQESGEGILGVQGWKRRASM